MARRVCAVFFQATTMRLSRELLDVGRHQEDGPSQSHQGVARARRHGAVVTALASLPSQDHQVGGA